MSECYIKESRKSWHRKVGQPTADDLRLGCLQRIADATEAMAKNHDDLVRQRDNARADRDFWRRECERERRSAIALRGVVTRLKRKFTHTVLADHQGGAGNG